MRDTAAPVAKLSRFQQAVLKWLLDAREAGVSDRFFGVRWSPGRDHRKAGQAWTAADRASWSRAVRRLELRGLVVRTNQSSGVPGDGPHKGQYRRVASEPHNRTTHLRLTALGIEAAKRLTKAVT
jgi:hypothetical protein